MSTEYDGKSMPHLLFVLGSSEWSLSVLDQDILLGVSSVPGIGEKEPVKALCSGRAGQKA
jgi:hypothetical protein